MAPIYNQSFSPISTISHGEYGSSDEFEVYNRAESDCDETMGQDCNVTYNIDQILDYVSYYIDTPSNSIGIKHIDECIRRCRNVGFRRSSILNYLIQSGYIISSNYTTHEDSIEDSLSYIQSMLQNKRSIPKYNEELVIVISAVAKLFILEIMTIINKQLKLEDIKKNNDNNNNNSELIIVPAHIQNAFSVHKFKIPKL
ncbi:uncharacterized protein CMU_042950 [Cryptosporidium muris RN66]|uniref:Uncharacterized protein n=1 Tax=Cryptosporidium muris (strain RN66) TaxID=441375 RepID=B6AAI0_CRYMR|nr:uncharacterized protein CMU_042950 [Cryptosporidium muris RN66]EEA05221.1 hypothetical protein, conserved [Cryptosporidium muris RN66]|eukprot:XP_002139570.1 hypothetical protein [Cryptosporidium muris RN66]